MAPDGTAECPACGSDTAIRVWADPEDAESEEPPDFIGCDECHTMTPSDEE